LDESRSIKTAFIATLVWLLVATSYTAIESANVVPLSDL
jgi:hypothetical protein